MNSGDHGKGRCVAHATPFPPGPIRLRWRVFSYLVPWLGAVATLFILIFPESPAETSSGLLHQALEIFATTPLLVSLGLAQFLQLPDGPDTLGLGIAVAVLVGHAGLTLSIRRALTLAVHLGIELLLLGIGVSFFLQFSRLSAGG